MSENSSKIIYVSVFAGDAHLRCILSKGSFATEKCEFSHSAHMHLQHEIHISLKGEFMLEDLTGAHRIKMTRNTVASFPPKFYHNCLTKNDEAEELIVRFDIEKNKSANKSEPVFDKLLSAISPKCGFLSLYIENAADLLEAAKCELMAEELCSEDSAKSYITLFMSRFIRQALKADIAPEDSNSAHTRSDFERTDKIENILETRYADQSFNAESLSKELCLSTRQTNRLLIEYYGMPFNKLLTARRLNLAKKLLISTDKPIGKIALEVGFSYESVFFKLFKEEFGVTPSKFRQDRKNSDS